MLPVIIRARLRSHPNTTLSSIYRCQVRLSNRKKKFHRRKNNLKFTSQIKSSLSYFIQAEEKVSMIHLGVGSAMDASLEGSSLGKSMDWQEEPREAKMRFKMKN